MSSPGVQNLPRHGCRWRPASATAWSSWTPPSLTWPCRRAQIRGPDASPRAVRLGRLLGRARHGPRLPVPVDLCLSAAGLGDLAQTHAKTYGQTAPSGTAGAWCSTGRSPRSAPRIAGAGRPTWARGTVTASCPSDWSLTRSRRQESEYLPAVVDDVDDPARNQSRLFPCVASWLGRSLKLRELPTTSPASRPDYMPKIPICTEGLPAPTGDTRAAAYSIS